LILTVSVAFTHYPTEIKQSPHLLRYSTAVGIVTQEAGSHPSHGCPQGMNGVLLRGADV